jgi:CheY-like chemotaxis protein
MNGISAAPPASSAQRALMRLLSTALADDARARRAIEAALSAARESSLPLDSLELLAWVREYLIPSVRAEVAPSLVAAMLEDLEAEIENENALDDPNSSARMAASTRVPPPGVAAPPEIAFPRDLGPTLASCSPPPVLQAPVNFARPVVILVDPDRFGRAALARALVQGRCDVRVLDSASEVCEALASGDDIHVLMTEVDGLEVELMLAALVANRPDLPVIVRTNSPRAVVEHLLHTAGVANYDVMAKSCKSAELIELVRTLATVI